MRTVTANILAVFIFAIGLAFFTAVANAASVSAELSWNAPTARVDGTPLDPSEIREYRIYYAVDDDIDPSAEPVIVSSGYAETVTIDLQPRAEPYHIVFAITAVDLIGLQSDLSDVVIKSVVVQSTAAPGAPKALQFEIRCVGECQIRVVE